MKRIMDSYCNPPFMLFKEKGRFPSNLTIGYEQECCVRAPYNDDEYRDWRTVAREEINKHKFLYAKEDCSVEEGGEINTHPFNWNWYRKNHIADYMDILKKRGVEADSNCGFHVHIGRNFFTDNHLCKMVKFFYANPDFIAKISQRDGKENLYEYANPDIDVTEMVENSYDPCQHCRKSCDNCEDSYETNPPPKADFNQLHFCESFVNQYSSEEDRFVALNLCPYKTVEIRIFQGTVNKKLAQAYLEFVVACVLYTKKTAFKNVSVRGFKRYVSHYRKLYPYLYRSGLLKGKVQKASYKWAA